MMKPTEDGGIYDTVNDVTFRNGTIVTRNHTADGVENFYRAVVKDGVWIRDDTGVGYSCLHSLNAAIVGREENIWDAWNYQNEEGSIQKIRDLRIKW